MSTGHNDELRIFELLYIFDTKESYDHNELLS